MFRVVYIAGGEYQHKGGFRSDKAANDWVREQGDKITPVSLLVWSEETQSFRKLEDY